MIGFPLVQNLTDFHKQNHSNCSGTKTATGHILTITQWFFATTEILCAKCKKTCQTNQKTPQKNSKVVEL